MELIIIAIVIALYILLIGLVVGSAAASLAIGIVLSLFLGIFVAFKICVLAIYENVNNMFMKVTLYIVLLLCGIALMGVLAGLTIWLVSIFL